MSPKLHWRPRSENGSHLTRARRRHGGGSFTWLPEPEINKRYWAQVEIQDQFWRIDFPTFIRPLAVLYRDPQSTGLNILASFVRGEARTIGCLASDPAAFGTLIRPEDRASAKEILAELISGEKAPPLCAVAAAFRDQRRASAALAKFASEHQSVYWALQKERANRTAPPPLEVKFLGKLIAVEPPSAAQKARLRKRTRHRAHVGR